MHLYKLDLLSQQDKLYVKKNKQKKSTLNPTVFKELFFVNHGYLKQRNMRYGDLGLQLPFFKGYVILPEAIEVCLN